MQPFRTNRILFPTDFSASSEALTAHVCGLAKELNATVCLLHVVADLSEWHGASERYFQPADGSSRNATDELRQAEVVAVRRLQELSKQHFDGLDTKICVVRGGVADSIVEVADTTDSDLIMMATRSRGSMRLFLIGSTTAKVLHSTKRPVWTFTHPRELPAFRPYRRIVCALDSRNGCAHVAATARELAAMFKSHLVAVTALPASETVPTTQEAKSRIRRALAAVQAALPVSARYGCVGEVVHEVAEVEQADLIVIGHGHVVENMGQFRTHVYEVIWNAPCPVLVV